LVVRDAKRIVRDGYNAIGDQYRLWSDASDPSTRVWFRDAVLQRIPHRAAILELGCGPGVDAVAFAAHGSYTGVDISDTMIELSRSRVPRGTFLRSDIADLAFPRDSFDAVVSFYVFGHLPADEHALVFRRVFDWLRPDGLFCSSFPLSAGEDVEEDFIGVPMFFGGIGKEATERALVQLRSTLEMSEERVDPVAKQDGFLWVIARKRA
jgi:SAM-dependent methyltransferase